MTSDELTRFRVLMGSHLTTADRREEAHEKRMGYVVNVWRLGHYLTAADAVMERIEAGATPEAAFSAHFGPTARLHTVAKKLGLALGVERGRWVPLAPAPAPATA